MIRNNALLTVNAMLRSIGRPQQVLGQRPVFDTCKVAMLRLMRGLIAPLRRSELLRRGLRAMLFVKKANYYYDNQPVQPARSES